MTSRTRLWVLAVSTPVIAFAFIGGYLGQAMAKDDTYQHLRVFEDVVSLVAQQLRRRSGRREGDARGDERPGRRLDPDSAYLTPDLVKADESNARAGAGRRRRRPHPSVLPARRLGARRNPRPRRPACAPATSSAASTTRRRATCRCSKATRLLQGAPGSKVTLLVIRGNAADPHDVVLVRERDRPRPT